MKNSLRNASLALLASASTAAFAVTDASNNENARESRSQQASDVADEALAFIVGVRGPIAASFTDQQSAQAVERACSQVTLDDGQKDKIKELCFNSKKAKINLKAQAKTTMLDYLRTISEPASKIEDAQGLSQKFVSQKTDLANLKVNTLNEVFYKILKADQRKPTLECAATIMAARKAESSED